MSLSGATRASDRELRLRTVIEQELLIQKEFPERIGLWKNSRGRLTMRSDNTKKRRKSHGWPFAAIHGFFSAFYYAYTDLIAVSLHVCRFHIFQNNRQEEYDMYFDQKEFGLRVKHLRRKHSLTQEQLADALYITATHLSKIECGQRGISIDLLLDLAAELDVSVDFLISGNPRTMGSVRMLIAQIRELLNRVESSEMD